MIRLIEDNPSQKGVGAMERLERFGRLMVLVLMMSVSSSGCAFAFWQADGTAVCTASVGQIEQQLISDGAGGAIITWRETDPFGFLDIFAQRVDASGTPLWGPDGVAICTDVASAWNPQITSDGAGGAIITWENNQAGDYDIYAQRVDASGTVLWAPDGIAICAVSGHQYAPRITSDGAGGAIIAWQDHRSGSNYDIYAQRVDASGNTQWGGVGVAVCTDTLDQTDPQIASDSQGGAVVTWRDWRSDNGDIFARRVDASGTPLWTPNGIEICAATDDQYYQHIVSTEAGGVIITWHDRRSVSWDIYAQLVDASGSVVWVADGVAIAALSGHQSYPQITSDGEGGAIITWRDGRSGIFDIYAQRVEASGTPLWAADGVVVCAASLDQYGPRIVSDGAGGAIITWRDSRAGVADDIYAQRVDASGAPLWAADGVAVCAASLDQVGPQITSDGAGGAIIAWQDSRNGVDNDIYAQRKERNGYWGYPAPDIYALRDVPGDQGGFVNLTWDASRLDPWPEMLISEYTVWRAVNPEAVAGMVEEGAHVLTGVSAVMPEAEETVLRVEEVQGDSFYWKLMSTLDAYYLDSYSEVVSTLFDSTSVSDEHHYFQVIAHTDNPSVFWVSEADSGYSVDNLSPFAPQGVAGDYSYPPAELLVTWDPNLESDLLHYAVYKGDYEGFVPGEGNRLGTVQDTFFADEEFDPNVENYYKVSAWDVHENESGYSVLRPDEITGVSGPPAVPTVTLLEQNVPNPFNPVTVIRFSVAQPGLLRLVVYDVAGRPVRTLVQGRREADRYEVTWDGRDGARRAVASGVYIYQLEAPGHVQSRKMVLLR
jgi:hypothetical protein